MGPLPEAKDSAKRVLTVTIMPVLGGVPVAGIFLGLRDKIVDAGGVVESCSDRYVRSFGQKEGKK